MARGTCKQSVHVRAGELLFGSSPASLPCMHMQTPMWYGRGGVTRVQQ